MAMVMGISDKVVAMDFGRKIAEGPRPTCNGPRGDRGLSRSGGVEGAASESAAARGRWAPCRVRAGQSAPRPRPQRRRRRDGGRARGQRRRQDDDDAGDPGTIPRGGTITFDGKDITKASADGIVRAGIAQVPQGRGTFPELTVEDNLRVGAYIRKDGESTADIERWFDVPRLAERRNQKAGSLSGGEQQMLAIARALMSRPSCCSATSRASASHRSSPRSCSDTPAAQPERARRPARRAERQPGDEDRAPGVPARDRPIVAAGDAERLPLTTPSARPTWVTDGPTSSTSCSSASRRGDLRPRRPQPGRRLPRHRTPQLAQGEMATCRRHPVDALDDGSRSLWPR